GHGTGHYRELCIGHQLNNPLGQETEGDNVREMPEGADEEQSPARAFRPRLESLQLDAVLDHTRVSGAQEAPILLRHHDHPSEPRDGAALVPMPAPPIPP